MITNKIIKDVIQIGIDGKPPMIPIKCAMLYAIPEDTQVINLSFDKLVLLIKGIVTLETDTTKYGFGSTTIVGKLVKGLKLKSANRHNQEVTDLINWAFLERKNEYIPFNVSIPLHVKSIQDYEAYLQERVDHRQTMQEKTNRIQREAKERKLKKMLLHQAKKERSRK